MPRDALAEAVAAKGKGSPTGVTLRLYLAAESEARETAKYLFSNKLAARTGRPLRAKWRPPSPYS
jgi:hypothetical protein